MALKKYVVTDTGDLLATLPPSIAPAAQTSKTFLCRGFLGIQCASELLGILEKRSIGFQVVFCIAFHFGPSAFVGLKDFWFAGHFFSQD